MKSWGGGSRRVKGQGFDCLITSAEISIVLFSTHRLWLISSCFISVVSKL